MNEKIIETNFKVGQLSTMVAADKSILENFRMEMECKIRDVLQYQKITDKSIANISVVQDRIEERVENDFKKYCVDHNERQNLKVSQSLAKQDEMIGVFKKHIGDLDAKYKVFAEKINASMNSSISSIMSIHTEEQ